LWVQTVLFKIPSEIREHTEELGADSFTGHIIKPVVKGSLQEQ